MQPPLRSIWPHPQASWASCSDRCMHLPCRDRHTLSQLLFTGLQVLLPLSFSGLQVALLCSWIYLRLDPLEARAQFAPKRAAYGGYVQHQALCKSRRLTSPPSVNTPQASAPQHCSAPVQSQNVQHHTHHHQSGCCALTPGKSCDPKGVCEVPAWHGKAKPIAEVTTGSMLAGMHVAQLERTSSLSY